MMFSKFHYYSFHKIYVINKKMCESNTDLKIICELLCCFYKINF